MKKIISLCVALVMLTAVFAGAGIFATTRPGDTNGDGDIDNKDVVILFRYVSGTTSGAVESNCDFNGDGTIDNKDVVSLFRAVSSGKIPEYTEETTAEETTEEITEETTEEITEEETTEEITEEETTEEETTEDLGEFIVVFEEDAELSVPHVFGSHMVLQRDAKIKVWGTSNKDGAQVRGTFMGTEARARISDGKWEIEFPAQPATTESQTLVIEDSCGNTITLTDILVGDVWIIGGQSNAKRTLNETGVRVTANKNTPLRIFQQDETDVTKDDATQEAAKNPCDDILNTKRAWKASSNLSAPGFSAIGWFFGNKLATETGIPQGVICMAAGAASIAELMPKELADEFGYVKGIFANPGSYYNALTHPFLRMKIKGMVFFQGEAEGGTNSVPASKDYARDFEALMTELRSRWGIDFPVYNVQLSNYVGDEPDIHWTHVGEVRTQQYEAYKKMSGVRLIPSYDLGSKTTDRDGVHSPYKEALANRISALALADLYGVGTADNALAPEPQEITVISSDGSNTVIEIKFTNVGGGLLSTNGTDTVSGFSYGKNVHPYDFNLTAVTGSIVSEDTIRLTVPSSSKYIGYACTKRVDTADVLNTELYNSNGLPALAFYLEIK